MKKDRSISIDSDSNHIIISIHNFDVTPKADDALEQRILIPIEHVGLLIGQKYLVKCIVEDFKGENR